MPFFRVSYIGVEVFWLVDSMRGLQVASILPQAGKPLAVLREIVVAGEALGELCAPDAGFDVFDERFH